MKMPSKETMIMTSSNNILRQIDELKARLVALRPLPAEALRKIEEALAIEYTYESNRIEGNTLTLQETVHQGHCPRRRTDNRTHHPPNPRPHPARH